MMNSYVLTDSQLHRYIELAFSRGADVERDTSFTKSEVLLAHSEDFARRFIGYRLEKGLIKPLEDGERIEGYVLSEEMLPMGKGRMWRVTDREPGFDGCPPCELVIPITPDGETES